MGIKQTSIGFNERQYKLLHKEKKRTGCSIGSIVRTSIEDHFQKKKVKKTE